LGYFNFHVQPLPEAEFILNNNLGHGFQLVFNIINQKAYPLMHRMKEQGYGIIARMPLQFGLLAGKFNTQSQFDEMDHRSFRLTPEIIEKANQLLEPAWLMAEKHNISKAQLALSYILSYPEISTVIPGIRTPEQAKMNTKPFTQLSHEEKIFLHSLYENKLQELLTLMQKQG
jgi:aryl-alcohol dehydrogenase-like predicted oxidoreductase